MNEGSVSKRAYAEAEVSKGTAEEVGGRGSRSSRGGGLTGAVELVEEILRALSSSVVEQNSLTGLEHTTAGDAALDKGAGRESR